MEIRLHGRGGQGGVTCAKILAAAYARLGKNVQTFGDYSGERSGAPVRAYTRVSDETITNRNKVVEPDHLVILDPSLLGTDTVQGLATGGTVLLNTVDSLEDFAGQFEAFRVAVVDATSIARSHGIGSRSLVIVNTSLAGAYARVHDISLDVLEQTYRTLGLASNFPAAKEAFEAVQIRPASNSSPVVEPAPAPGALPSETVEPITTHRSSLPTGLQTGSWSTQRPNYVQNLAPCNAWCPAGNDVVGFVQAVGTQDENAAAKILGATTPLAGVCGRVCPAPCMEGCNRVEYDGAVNIRGLERWIADASPVARTAVEPCESPKRVAIVGGGPAGLSAAYYLAATGHSPTLIDGEAELGGVLVTGIPVYRLPREALRREVEGILALGVETRLNTQLGPDEIASLPEEYDAAILATGLQKLRGLDAPGADLEGIEQGITFLHRANIEGAQKLSGHVVVLGGGNTAVDCARSALRAGAERVTIAYRRTREEMPAITEEIAEAVDEGVELALQRQPVGFQGEGRIQAVLLAEVDMGEPDESGRRRPVVSERTSALACDHVFLALGQSADTSLLPEGWELRDERLWQGGEALRVVAAGDLATGDGTVTHAIGSGRRAAGLALQAAGVDCTPFERPDRTLAVPATDVRFDHFERREAACDQLLDAPARVRSTDEVNCGMPSGEEATRCFSCGHCTQCDTCLVYCPEGIIHRAEVGYDVDYSYCKGCGVCVEECPRKAMEMRTA